MCKRLSFLISIVLVLGLCTASKATTIDVNNFSFEYDCDGNQVTCHTGHQTTPGEQCDAGIAGWRYTEGGTGWTGIDVNVAEGMCDDGRDWIEYTDGYANIFFQGIAAFHQIMDFDIALGHKYTMSVDLAAFGDNIVLEIFALPDPCFPDANHIEISQTVYYVSSVDDVNTGRTTFERFTATAVVDDPAIVGMKLGIKIGGDMLIGGTDTSYLWADNVSLEWSWATTAYDPNPSDNAVLVSKSTDVDWKPGLWAATTGGHEVYFGTDETAVANADSTDTTGIYRITKDTNDYTPTESPLVLGETYYWKITELNSTPPGGGVPAPPWEGDVWSFTVEGGAYDPSPADGETDVVFLGLELSWTAGAEAETHLVYFGTDAQAVEDATTSSPEYKAPPLTVGTETYPVTGQLTVGATYYWRIDEKSNGGAHTVKGDVWQFQVGQFLIVDDFEDYTSQAALWNVWDDYWVNGSDGEIFLESDVNIIREEDSQAARLKFTNETASGGKQIGSQFDVQDMSELNIGSNWTIGGVKALFLYLRGDPCNAQVVPDDAKGTPLWEAATPWVELEDTSNNKGYVVYPTGSHMGWDTWLDPWNIDLAIFDACGVNLTAIDRFTIGIGGYAKTGQKSAMSGPGYLYVDDIRLYPPRCRPEMSGAVGDITGDCNVMMDDVDIMATDWLMADGYVSTETQNGTITMLAGSPNWTSGYVGTGSLGFDPNIEIDVCDPRLMGINNMSITLWAKRKGEQEPYVGIVTCREKGVEDSTELAGGSKGDSVGYCWNQIAKTWQFSSGLTVPDGQWCLMAMAVDPNGCTLYSGPAGGLLDSARQDIALPPLAQFDEKFWIGRGRDTSRYYIGNIDDVRIYDKTLTADEIAWLHTGGVDGNDPNCPAYYYEMDDGSGLTVSDSGCGATVYRPVLSPANLTNPEAAGSRFVNMADYGILADNWMTQDWWP